MSEPTRRHRIPILGSMGRTARLTWVEIVKLFAHKFFLFTVLITLVVTLLLGIFGKHFSDNSSNIRFTNYSLWVVTASFGLQVATILLVALGAMAVSSEATARTLNTVLCRPIRRIEFVVAKALSLVFATVVVVAVTAAASFVVGGTVEPAGPRRILIQMDEAEPEAPQRPPSRWPTYGPIVDPEYPETEIAPLREVMGNILFGFVLVVLPVLAAVSVGFLIGTLVDSAALAIGLAVGFFLSLETTKFFPLLEEYLGGYAYNYPINRLFTLMRDAGNGAEIRWAEARTGIEISALYIVVFFAISFLVFWRRDVTL